MLRPRSLNRWNVCTEYESAEAFLGTGTGHPHVHSIKHNGTYLDLLVHDRGASTTLVSFHAALTKRALTLPSLQGAGLAADTDCNLIAVSDPTLSAGDIDLSWFLGDKRTGPLPPIYSPLIQHALNQLGSSRTILFGASGGGYAAALYGEHFPDSIVLAVNPRLDLGARPSAEFGQYLDVAHQVHTNHKRVQARKEFATVRLRQKYGETGLPFDLCIYQNENDLIFMDHQVRPFVSKLSGDPRLFTRLGKDGRGHRPIPGEKLREIVRAMSADSDQRSAIESAGFTLVRQTWD